MLKSDQILLINKVKKEIETEKAKIAFAKEQIEEKEKLITQLVKYSSNDGRGGKRINAGRKAKYGKTQAVRIPIIYKDAILKQLKYLERHQGMVLSLLEYLDDYSFNELIKLPITGKNGEGLSLHFTVRRVKPPKKSKV